MSWIGSAIGAVGSLLGGMNTNAANASLNQANMNWQTMMSDTAMQRREADLQKAGFNPLLAVSQGGASTPGFSPIPMQNPFGPGAAASAQGIQPRMQAAQLDQTKADTNLKNAQAANTSAQTGNVPILGQLASAQVDQVRQQISESQATVSAMLTKMGLDYATTRNVLAANPGITADSSLKGMQADQFAKVFDSAVKSAISSNLALIEKNGYQNFLNSTDVGRFIQAAGPGVAAAAAQSAYSLLHGSHAIGENAPTSAAPSGNLTLKDAVSDYNQWSASHGGEPFKRDRPLDRR